MNIGRYWIGEDEIRKKMGKKRKGEQKRGLGEENE